MDEDLGCDSQMKQYFHMVLFIMSYKVVSTLKSVDKTLECVTIQMKVTEQYSRVILFIMLHKVVQAVESVDKIPGCHRSNENH